MVLETPIKLTDKQKQSLREFKDSLGGSDRHSPKEKSWFDGVRHFFDGLKS